MEDLKVFIQNELSELVFKTVSFDEKLISTKTLDSISLIDLIVAIEDHLDISIPTSDVIESNFDSIDLISEYINNLRTK